MAGSVSLTADGGKAASGPDFFRSSPFLLAEGVTHSLVLTTATGCLALPVIVRDIPGTHARDAISPYGYPGGLLDGDPIDPEQLDFTGSGLVSLFVRDRIGARSIVGGIVRPPVYLYQPDRPHEVGATFHKHVRRNERRGIVVDLTRGPDVDALTVEQFGAVYTQTMHRAGAMPRYLFPVQYLQRCLQFEHTWLLTARNPDGDLAAASIIVLSDGRLHYFLEGTQDRFRSWSPGKNCVQRALQLAADLRTGINFGGGLAPDDGIATFKRSFCNAEERFTTHAIVCDAEAYTSLVSDRPCTSDFFPAYRSPSSRPASAATVPNDADGDTNESARALTRQEPRP